jgi:hypothetical protein
VRPVLPWIAAYLAILLVWALIILRRTGPTLWKGRSLVAVNIAFVLVLTAVVVLKGRTFGNGLGDTLWCCVPPGFIVFDLVLIIVAALVRNKWLLLRINHTGSAAILERCFKQTRAPWTRRPGGYTIQCAEAEMTVTIRPTLLGPISVRFTGGTDSKKGALLCSLFGKQFHSSFPTPRIRA